MLSQLNALLIMNDKMYYCSQTESFFLCYSGIIGPSFSYEVWDHCYVSLKDSQEKSETPPEMKPPSPCSETLQDSSLSTEQETNGMVVFTL